MDGAEFVDYEISHSILIGGREKQKKWIKAESEATRGHYNPSEHQTE